MIFYHILHEKQLTNSKNIFMILFFFKRTTVIMSEFREMISWKHHLRKITKKTFSLDKHSLVSLFTIKGSV